MFRTVDGATHPTADVSTSEKRRLAFALLLARGLVRVETKVPAGAEFEVVGVDDPYGYATAATLSLYRRPLPTANVSFLSTTMWDGRETTSGGTALRTDLLHQANSAQEGHAEGRPLTDAERAEIVDFELALFFAQVVDREAGSLDGAPARGGPNALSSTPFYIGINDPIGLNPTGAPFDPNAMKLFDGWVGDRDRRGRDAIARGAAIFNSKRFEIRDVRGVNDDLSIPSLTATCTTCHDSPNVGNHSVPFPVDIGLTTAARRTPDVPLYTLRKVGTAETIRTTDPGRAMVTGKWKDVGRFKGPVLRGLGARAPYFHDGSASSIRDVVDFYEDRFDIRLNRDEKDDLVAFLAAL